MKFPPFLRERAVEIADGDTGSHITFHGIAGGDTEPIMVTIDHLSTALHRWLWEQVRGPLSSTDFLMRTCDHFGCVSPWHRDIVATPHPPRTTCPNGHAYDDATDLEGRLRCAVCAAERLARRQAGYDPFADVPNAQKTVCRHGHAYTEENTYRWVDSKGQAHRRCRTCTLERSRLRRLSEVAETIG